MKKFGLNRKITLRASRRGLLLAVVAALVLGFGRKLWSQAQTLVTRYPAPSGVYNQIITTGDAGAAPADTTLNRNGGNTILVPPANAGGKVGIGTANPAEKLDIAGNIRAASGRFSGGVRLGDDPSACNGAKAGTIRWHAGILEGCNGSAWKSLFGGGAENPKCYDAGGAWDAGQKQCYLASGSCPSGWGQTGYTSTVRNTCAGATACTTGSHWRANAAIETCSYYIATPNACKGCPQGHWASCSAILTERGCTPPP